ncbi:MAG: hypothetical protein Q7U66_06055 [Methylobacter sp.]|nr:hypothetical protein [Methylobacter sp.]
MANLKTRLAALEVLANPKLDRPIHIIRADDTPEQVALIAEYESRGEFYIRFTRALEI